ncbi:MAG: ComF family protein [Caldilineaceae bacterium]|nr:ComF family protein [Caldilineaceae bacterium]
MQQVSPDLVFRLRTLANRALDLLFPPACVACGHSGAPLCSACAQRAEPVTAPICARCGRRTTHPRTSCPLCAEEHSTALTMVRSAALHTSPLREAIHAFKYEARPDAARPLARYLVAAFMTAEWRGLDPAVEVVVPVPLHAERRAERGYNQAELLAEAFCRRVGLPCRPDWLERHQFTRPQVGLNAEERQENVSAAFAAASEVSGRTLLLIDDVYTTGSTLRACADAARQAGARGIYGLTLAQPAGSRVM